MATNESDEIENTYSVFFNNSHSVDLLSKLNKLRVSSSFHCDVIICVQNYEIPAHRCVLAASSSYFDAMFSSDMQESKSSKIHMRGLKKETLVDVINFIYTGRICISETNVESLIHVSSMFFLNSLTQGCCSFLSCHLSLTNCLDVRSLAVDYSCKQLLESANGFIYRNFLQIIDSEEFKILPVETLEDIISSDDLDVSNEDMVLRAINLWVNHEPETRCKCFPHLLDKIRLPFLCMEKYQAQDVLAELLTNKLFVQNCGPLVLARKSYRKVECILVIGGCSDAHAQNSTFCYIPSMQIWKKLSALNHPKWRFTLAEFDGQIHVFDVAQDAGTPILVEKFDSKLNCWEVAKSIFLPPIEYVYTGSEGVCIDKNLYLVGGLNLLTSNLSTAILCINPLEEERICEVSSLRTPRESHCVVTDTDGFYIIGGHEESNISEVLDSVEYYNIKEDINQYIPALRTRRCFTSSIMAQNRLYVIGGYDGTTVLSSAEVYDPITREWNDIANMKKARMKCEVALCDGKIYVFGGTSSLIGPILSTAECYNLQTGLWDTTVPQMPSPRCDIKCCTVQVPYRTLFPSQNVE